MMNVNAQENLFPEGTLPATEEEQSRLTRDTSLQAALGAFEQHMQDEGFAINTIKAFASDIRLLGKYAGIGLPIGEVDTKGLNDFLNWLVYERGVPCSQKSYARRVTTLKVFFNWLLTKGAIPADPATAVIQFSVSSPLPHLPTEAQIRQAEAIAHSLRTHEDPKKRDARPDMLLHLLLQTGIKKGEAMSIVPNHIDRGDPDNPVLFVRYPNPRLRYKERKVPLTPEWLQLFDEYLAQYAPTDTIFDCTARNLEYVLHDIAIAGGIEPKGLISFENLRWVSALRDMKAGVELDDIRQKLGLSKVSWRETRLKLEKLWQMEREADGLNDSLTEPDKEAP